MSGILPVRQSRLPFPEFTQNALAAIIELIEVSAAAVGWMRRRLAWTFSSLNSNTNDKLISSPNYSQWLTDNADLSQLFPAVYRFFSGL